MMPLPLSLSVIVPAFNEARRIEKSLISILHFLENRGGEFEVIVVDDGSTDNTVAIVERLARDHPLLRVMVSTRNRGKGAAVRSGMLAAKHEVVLFSDADLSTPIEEIAVVLPLLLGGADMVIASREHVRTEISVDQKVVRKNMGRTFNRVMRGITGLEPRDTQCGFKAFRREAAQQIFGCTRIDGFAFDVELLVIARARGLQVAEAPVVWENSPDSRVRIIRHSLQMLRDLLRIRYFDWRGKYR